MDKKGKPFYKHGLIVIPACIKLLSIHMPSKAWDEITDPSPNFKFENE